MTTSEDPRFPGGMNYIDWLMNVLSPDDATTRNIEEIIEDIRARRAVYEAGGKVKKGAEAPEPNRLAKALGLSKKRPTVWRRPL